MGEALTGAQHQAVDRRPMLNVFGGAEHQAHFVLLVVLIVGPICVLLVLRTRLNVISVPIYVLIYMFFSS